MKRNKGLFAFTVLMSVLALTALSCGISDIPNPFATDTPTPTLTFTPTFTPSPSPTATRTPTPTPLPTGVTSEEASDGSTLFIDYDNNYQLVLPEEWVIIPLDQDDFAVAIDELAQENPDLVASAEAFRSMDPDVLRLAALNKDPKYFKNGYASNITIAGIEDSVFSVMPLSFVTGVLEESFTQQGIKVLTTGVNTIENDHGVEVEYMDVEQTVDGLKAVQRLVVFLTKGKLIMVTITTLPEFKDEIFQAADEIGKSIEFLK